MGHLKKMSLEMTLWIANVRTINIFICNFFLCYFTHEVNAFLLNLLNTSNIGIQYNASQNMIKDFVGR